ncbi:MAG: tetratricopeptide repeat protein, partial [Rhodospirillales bacterium]
MRSCFLLAIPLAISLLATVPARASYEQGLKAYEADQVSLARDLWEQAAQAGDRRAQYELGRLYERGKGRILRRDFASAIKWYSAAAEQAYPEAYYALGVMSENGDGMRQDYLQALRYYNFAVRYAGLPKAYFAIGQMYFHGRGVPQDYLKAIESYIAAARGGYAPAQYVYGALLEQ